MRKLQQAFQNADTDNDGRLRHSEIQDFGKKMFNKKCPYEVYIGMCNYCNRDLEIGLSWEDVLRLFVDSNKSGPAAGGTPYSSNRRRSLSSNLRKHKRSASVGVNYQHRKVPARRNKSPKNNHRRARSDLNGGHSPGRRRSRHSRRSSYSEFANIFDRFQRSATRDKDRELINLLLERLRETQITIEEKEEDCVELTKDLTEQRERRMSAENRIKRHRQEVEAHHSRNSVDVHRQTVSWERYRALSEELSAVEEASKDAQHALRSCGKRVDHLKNKRFALKEENLNLTRQLENSGITSWKRRLEILRSSLESKSKTEQPSTTTRS